MQEHRHALNKAYQNLKAEIASIKQMVGTIPEIYSLKITDQTKHVATLTKRLIESYFQETTHTQVSHSWDQDDSFESILFDGDYAELDYETTVLETRLSELSQSLQKLEQIHQNQILPQALVLLVGSLEVYLSTTFEICLRASLENKHSNALVDLISSRFNFQNWGDSVKAFKNFNIDILPPQIKAKDIVYLQEMRHVVVHRLGILDDKAVKRLRLHEESIGQKINVSYKEISNDIQLVQTIGDHVHRRIRI